MIRLLRAEEMGAFIQEPKTEINKVYPMDYLMRQMELEVRRGNYSLLLTKKSECRDFINEQNIPIYYKIEETDIKDLERLGYIVYESKSEYRINWFKLSEVK